MISSSIQRLFKLKFNTIWVSKKRNNKESMICLMLKTSQSLFIWYIQSKEKILQQKSFLRKKGSGGSNNKWKEGFLTALAMAIKKNPQYQ